MTRPCPPVLIVAFNRPDSVAQLVAAIETAKPTKVYVAVDGPRDHVPEDAAKCARVREIVSDLPWEHELHTLFRDQNLGCGPAVSGAITWFFEHEPEGIVLEDDVLPHPSMFPFMADMLERYRDDERVQHISGSNYSDARVPGGYFFSRYVAIWGWASWRRAWQHFDLDISDWKRSPDVLDQPGLDWRTRRYLAFAFGRAEHGLGNWDYQWKYAVMRNGLAITPNANLSVTTGFGDEATALRKAGPIPALETMPTDVTAPATVDVDPTLEHAMFHEQLGRGEWYWELSRLIVFSPRLYHRIGNAVRALARRLRG